MAWDSGSVQGMLSESCFASRWDGAIMYTFTSKVRFSETDESGNLSLPALLDYLQDCCLFQADSLGIGPEYLRQRHRLWMLSGWQVVVDRYPRMFERIVIGTKAYEFKGCFCMRNVLIHDEGGVPNPQTVNRTIERICNSYNAEELVNAKKEHREPIILPEFSCHHLRHTFCTRLCENESNLKVIQSIMGHRNIQTTMDIYAEATEQKKQESFVNLAAKMDVF